METSTRDVTDADGTKGLEAEFDVPVPPTRSSRSSGRPPTSRGSSRTSRRRASSAARKATLEIAYRVDVVIREVSYVLRRVLDRRARTITWREVSGDLRRVRGGWTSAAGREGAETSRVRYSAFVDVGRFVPTALVRDGAKRKLGEMIERVRRVAVELHSAAAPPPNRPIAGDEEAVASSPRDSIRRPAVAPEVCGTSFP